jgi:hypothetical protein
VDLSNIIDRIDYLVVQGKFIFNSIIGVSKLLVYDGGIERMELDLFYSLVTYRTYDLLWLQPKKQ